MAGGKGQNDTMGRRTGWLIAAVLVGAGVILSGCNTSKVGTKAAYAEDEPAAVLYNRGLGYLNAGKMTDAIKSFDEVDRQHPYSEEARKSLVMSSFAAFRKGDYTTAIASSQRYLTLYPGTPEAAYAEYIIGQSYYAQIPDVTRDQKATKQALQAMQDIIAKYPDSEYADDARTRIVVTRDQLAGKEMQVGRYYLERREYVAAINRFKFVVVEYPDTRHVEEALERLVEANLALGIVPEAQTAAAVLGHNYPDSQWYKDAYNLLQKKGVAPQDNGGDVSTALSTKPS